MSERRLSLTFLNNYSTYFYVSVIEERFGGLVALREPTTARSKDFIYMAGDLSPFPFGAPSGERCLPITICPYCHHTEDAFELLEGESEQAETTTVGQFWKLWSDVDLKCWVRQRRHSEDSLKARFDSLYANAGRSRFSYAHCGCSPLDYWRKVFDYLNPPFPTDRTMELKEHFYESACSEFMKLMSAKKPKSVSRAETRFFQMTNAAAQLQSL